MAWLKGARQNAPRPASPTTMRIVSAFMATKELPTPTGGQRFNLQLMDAWGKVAEIRFADVRYRWIRLRCWGPALLCFHLAAIRRADVLFQAASATIVSSWLIRACRLLFPKVKHVGIVYHPLWLEQPELRQQECRLYNTFDYLLTISQHVADSLRREGIRPPIYLLPPGRSKMPARTAPQADPPLIFWNGYLLPRKGPLVLLEALEHLSAENWQASFLVSMRPSPEFDRKFQARLQAMPDALQSRIHFFDHLPMKEFRVQFFRGSIFCLPSLVEGYSISTAEAMACGCAVVVPRTENFVELLGTPDYAGFYDPAEPDSLARKLDQLLLEPELRSALATACLERSAHLPDWEQFGEHARALLRQIVPDATQAATCE